MEYQAVAAEFFGVVAPKGAFEANSGADERRGRQQYHGASA